MRWLVMGAGATGGYFGGRLAQAGEDVTFVARGEHLEALRRNGLTLHSTLGDVTLPVRTTNDPTQIEPVDAVLFAVKSFDTTAAIDLVAPVVGPNTRIICIQNGVEHEEQLAERFGAERVAGGATRIESLLSAPGVVSHLSPFARFTFGPWQGPITDVDRQLHERLLAAGAQAQLEADGRRVVWEKFVFLCPLAAITAVTRATAGECRELPETRSLLVDLVDEAVTVAACEGVSLGPTAAQAVMSAIDGVPHMMRTSLERDISAGRRSELDALSGAVVRLAGRHGISAPAHSTVLALLVPAQRAAEQPRMVD